MLLIIGSYSVIIAVCVLGALIFEPRTATATAAGSSETVASQTNGIRRSPPTMRFRAAAAPFAPARTRRQRKVR